MFLLQIATTVSLLSDSVAPPRPLAFASESSSDVIFVMMPAQPGKFTQTQEKAYGVVCKLNEKGKLEELYRTRGWYSSKVYVSADGRYLVRMGPWNSGSRPKEDDLAVAFYKDGKLLKKYSTAVLVKNHSKVEATASHYFWQAACSAVSLKNGRTVSTPRLDYSNEFRLCTIDGWTYTFDATTGEIKTQEIFDQVIAE